MSLDASSYFQMLKLNQLEEKKGASLKALLKHEEPFIFVRVGSFFYHSTNLKLKSSIQNPGYGNPI